MGATVVPMPVTTDTRDNVPPVGPREPCPCGSGKRYKQCHGRAKKRQATARTGFVSRPFADLASETDWVAMAEILPAATAPLRLNPEFGGHELTLVTVLPLAWAALRRESGEMLVASQTLSSSGDASRDIAAAALAVTDVEPGTPVPSVGIPTEGPRLQDVLDTAMPLVPTLHEGFDYWLDEDSDTNDEVAASLEQANESITPTVRLTSVTSAYWVDLGNHEYLRWVLPYEEELLLDALARLHAARESDLGLGTRLMGAFRSLGLLIPVWELGAGDQAAEIEEPVAQLQQRLEKVLAVSEPLTAEERRARAGLVSRQLTLR